MPANVKLLVYKRGVPVATGKITDASRSGLFIDTKFDEVQINQMLEVEFGLSGPPECHHQRLEAVVTRKTKDGLALELGGLTQAQVQCLQHLYNDLETERLTRP
ncbi:MAG: PilZ domain-containing protein [Oleiphilaceae bacterium]|nr:PilZ domain-containing protein [Oleiphilaceae bacterium]